MGNDSRQDAIHGCESNPELNGADAFYRSGPLISPPRSVRKIRIGGVLVPMNAEYGPPNS